MANPTPFPIEPTATPNVSSGSSSSSIDESSVKDSISIHRQVVSDLVDENGEQFSWSKLIFRRGPFNPPPVLDAIATKRSKDYENIHRFDPAARWTYREEKVNFNLGTTIFRLSFLCAELPSQLISKRVGPDRWIPTQICLWSIVALSQFWLKGRSSFLLSRALLGFIPDLILYMSYFYTKTELPIRLAFFWMSMNLCSILASFLAYGTLHLDGVAGQAGWRWLFLIEGSLTLLIGVATFCNMPPSPTQTKAWFRPKGWFTEREEVIMVNRVLRDDPSKGDMHNREGLTLKRLWTAVCDYDLWPVYILGLMFGIPSAPPSTYLTILLRNSGFNTFQTNLLTIPSQAMGILTMFIITVVSESVGERTLIAMMEDLWILPFLVTLYALPSSPNPWAFFAVITGLLSYPYVGWCSRNSGAVASRTVNASLYNMFVQASSIISAQIYVASDSPRYERGNRILIIICCVNLVVLYSGTKAYYVWRNRQRAKIWDAMTPQEQAHYLSTTKDVGNRRLDFRFAH
ncbi:allantoate permease [Melanogaster broomeanus]|nr:allantoate permease [Melanogaster broomeanus]